MLQIKMYRDDECGKHSSIEPEQHICFRAAGGASLGNGDSGGPIVSKKKGETQCLSYRDCQFCSRSMC